MYITKLRGVDLKPRGGSELVEFRERVLVKISVRDFSSYPFCSSTVSKFSGRTAFVILNTTGAS